VEFVRTYIALLRDAALSRPERLPPESTTAGSPAVTAGSPALTA